MMIQIRRITTVVVSLLLSLFGLSLTGAATAFAQVPPPDPVAPATTSSVIGPPAGSASGLGILSGWEVALAAVGVALVAACLTVLVQRIATGRRPRRAAASY
jgi:hypothetical protein